MRIVGVFTIDFGMMKFYHRCNMRDTAWGSGPLEDGAGQQMEKEF